jgi:hypothetical protein
MPRRSGTGDTRRDTEHPPRRGEVTVAELIGRKPGPTAHHHLANPADGPPTERRGPFKTGGHQIVLVVAGASAVLVLAILGFALFSGGSAKPPAADTSSGATHWLRAYASGAVVSDPGFGQQLQRDGWRSGPIDTPANCAHACPDGWVVSTPALRAASAQNSTMASALSDSVPVAVFGSDDGRIEVRRSGAGPASTGPASTGPESTEVEATARRTVGAALAGLNSVTLSPSAQPTIRSGQADPRLLAMIATLAQSGPVHVADLPAIAGEDAAGQPRRQLLLTVPPGGPGVLTSFFAAQTGPYRPASVTPTRAGLLVVYPPLAPPHLLDAFAGS